MRFSREKDADPKVLPQFESEGITEGKKSLLDSRKEKLDAKSELGRVNKPSEAKAAFPLKTQETNRNQHENTFPTNHDKELLQNLNWHVIFRTLS